ncbi:MAG: glutathione S-transferase family protein [Myxococcota bacterium]
MTEPAPIFLWQTGGCWGLPSTSPFSIKLEAWLRMNGVPFEIRVLRGRPRSANRKIPYIEHPDGRIVGDSGVIMATLREERGLTLDEGLDPRQQAIAIAVTRMLEDHFYWAIVWDRWFVSEHWPATRQAYFGWLPAPLRGFVPGLLRRAVRRAFDGQGFGRMPTEQIVTRARQDLGALAQLLGDGEHMLGRPSSLDATVFAFVASALWPPFDGPLQRAAREHTNLVALCERTRARWWSLAGPGDLD